ncbi:MAG: hypothetical protein HYR60_31240 [Acidobacteria bacterium]|nr:hypothetical protein [Acidobacteriota bacterium]MBI3471879.1 hypothetical protein [Candidatus Solibacter usitatus]
MIRTLTKTWWLLALCGFLDATHAAMNLLMLNLDGSLTLRRFAPLGAVGDMSVLAVAAGACVIATGLWNSGRNNSWLLSLHGLALAAFGLIGLSPLVRGPLSFRPVSLLFVVMSVSIGAFALRTAKTLRRGAQERWLLGAVVATSLGFAFSFLAVGFDWVRLGAPYSFWIWMSSYFAFCAIFMLWLALRVHSQSLPQPGRREASLPIRSPRHAQ